MASQRVRTSRSNRFLKPSGVWISRSSRCSISPLMWNGSPQFADQTKRPRSITMICAELRTADGDAVACHAGTTGDTADDDDLLWHRTPTRTLWPPRNHRPGLSSEPQFGRAGDRRCCGRSSRCPYGDQFGKNLDSWWYDRGVRRTHPVRPTRGPECNQRSPPPPSRSGRQQRSRRSGSR